MRLLIERKAQSTWVYAYHLCFDLVDAASDLECTKSFLRGAITVVYEDV